jgi:hypothetical protein
MIGPQSSSSKARYSGGMVVKMALRVRMKISVAEGPIGRAMIPTVLSVVESGELTEEPKKKLTDEERRKFSGR